MPPQPLPYEPSPFLPALSGHGFVVNCMPSSQRVQAAMVTILQHPPHLVEQPSQETRHSELAAILVRSPAGHSSSKSSEHFLPNVCSQNRYCERPNLPQSQNEAMLPYARR